MAKQLKITQVRSRIRETKRAKQTLDALGLRKINQSRVHEDSAQLRGMVGKIPHLVKVEESDT